MALQDRFDRGDTFGVAGTRIDIDQFLDLIEKRLGELVRLLQKRVGVCGRLRRIHGQEGRPKQNEKCDGLCIEFSESPWINAPLVTRAGSVLLDPGNSRPLGTRAPRASPRYWIPGCAQQRGERGLDTLGAGVLFHIDPFLERVVVTALDPRR